MKIWPLILLLSLVPTALAVETFAEELALEFREDNPPCASAPLRPFPAALTAVYGSVIARVHNVGDASQARICLFDAWGAKRADMTLTFAPGETRDVTIAAPSGSYWIRMERVGSSSGYAAASISTRWCDSRTADTEITIRQIGDGSGHGIRGGSCVGNTAALAGFGLAGSALAVMMGKAPHVGAFLLYSRLAKPRLLDSALRGRIHDLVVREPGIHSREIGRAVGAADGQVAHHLGVLAREKILVNIGFPGFRHWFVAGRHAPAQMRAFATLRDPTRRALYDLIAADPGVTLRSASGSIGVSVPQGSRATKALERAGLVERRKGPRGLLLRAVVAPSELYGATART